MKGFKEAKDLYDERLSQGKINEYERPLPEAGEPTPSRHDPRRPKTFTQCICEQWDPGGCKGSQEAVKLGLAEKVFACQGLVPPVCTLRQQLASGMTIQEIYQK